MNIYITNLSLLSLLLLLVIISRFNLLELFLGVVGDLLFFLLLFVLRTLPAVNLEAIDLGHILRLYCLGNELRIDLSERKCTMSRM